MICPWPKTKEIENLSLKAYLNLYSISTSQQKKYLPKHLLEKKISFFLSKKDHIELPVDLTNAGMIAPFYKGPEIKVIEDKSSSLFALEKPSLVHCIAGGYEDYLNCLSFLRASGHSTYFSQYSQRDKEKGLLYRLDFETSGVLVFCKDPNLTREIFKNRDQYITEKIYYARVKRKCQLTGEVCHYLRAYGPRGSRQEAVRESDMEKHKRGEYSLGILEIINSKYDEITDTTSLKIKLKTGHRHQIRTQLASLGHPICGDNLYENFYTKKRTSEKIETGKIDLHAYKYSIRLSDGRIITFKSEPDWPH